ncbi:hypothetical protein PAPYR_8973 [Paratrimastix pyriformis]|uniref:Uncharacterized protein n=1 Tax=Paratrimastix pyriformis TaxID=342808 RepID=A0ABQ8U9F5_9EUKA|nr:hypothetical protein PAPYR_8973 [Paratrimastix pyriformis]
MVRNAYFEHPLYVDGLVDLYEAPHYSAQIFWPATLSTSPESISWCDDAIHLRSLCDTAELVLLPVLRLFEINFLAPVDSPPGDEDSPCRAIRVSQRFFIDCFPPRWLPPLQLALRFAVGHHNGGASWLGADFVEHRLAATNLWSHCRHPFALRPTPHQLALSDALGGGGCMFCGVPAVATEVPAVVVRTPAIATTDVPRAGPMPAPAYLPALWEGIGPSLSLDTNAQGLYLLLRHPPAASSSTTTPTPQSITILGWLPTGLAVSLTPCGSFLRIYSPVSRDPTRDVQNLVLAGGRLAMYPSQHVPPVTFVDQERGGLLRASNELAAVGRHMYALWELKQCAAPLVAGGGDPTAAGGADPIEEPLQYAQYVPGIGHFAAVMQRARQPANIPTGPAQELWWSPNEDALRIQSIHVRFDDRTVVSLFPPASLPLPPVAIPPATAEVLLGRRPRCVGILADGRQVMVSLPRVGVRDPNLDGYIEMALEFAQWVHIPARVHLQHEVQKAESAVRFEAIQQVMHHTDVLLETHRMMYPDKRKR